MLSTTSSDVSSTTSIKLISFPSLSVPIGSYRDISRFNFRSVRSIISNSLSIHRAAYVPRRLPLSALNVFKMCIRDRQYTFYNHRPALPAYSDESPFLPPDRPPHIFRSEYTGFPQYKVFSGNAGITSESDATGDALPFPEMCIRDSSTGGAMVAPFAIV